MKTILYDDLCDANEKHKVVSLLRKIANDIEIDRAPYLHYAALEKDDNDIVTNVEIVLVNVSEE